MVRPTRRYEIVRKFTGGTLVGMTHKSYTSVYVKSGFRCDNPVGGSPYVVISCKRIG